MCLPEGDGVGVGTFSLPDEEGPIPGNPHQHVLCFSTAQPIIVPPAAWARKTAERGGKSGLDVKAPETRPQKPPWTSHHGLPIHNASEDGIF